MATLRNKHPAKVAPIALSKGLFLKFLDRIGRVPKNVTIKKNVIMTTILSMTSALSSSILISYYNRSKSDKNVTLIRNEKYKCSHNFIESNFKSKARLRAYSTRVTNSNSNVSVLSPSDSPRVFNSPGCLGESN